MQTDLSKFNNNWFNPGAGVIKRWLWFYINTFFVNSYLIPLPALKVFLLRLFGAKIGKGVMIKPKVNIKYPWNISIGDYSWIGEDVWIDSLSKISIGKNVCISQGAFLLTGNHDFTKSSFDLIVKEIVIEDGVWIGAKAVVCPGIVCYSHAILTVGSIATKELEAYSIYQGNPAQKIKNRNLIS
ncbi:MAG: WcaF family extracellular polysaccharide biosynthesis acetyltransferase [Chitinophagaceae bacterium]|nr:WcaF family extracellular polysaccharide biosynthesis acetyltransferase [Chitinophagaceae bacterium]MCW5905685.1 WcaF family extracellular polysaccharide biosynthesis acetyltransferase [Chitinophagaceae bacterium]